MDTITKYALDFLENNWDNIDLVKLEITSKETLIEEVKTDICTASWVLTEVMSWGCINKIDYFETLLKVSHEKEEDQLVIKIGEEYFKLDYKEYLFVPCVRKTKTVVMEYFE